MKGGFDADCKIGFSSLVTFNYLSRVSYDYPKVPINFKNASKEWFISSFSPQSSIFNSLESKWVIKNTSVD